MQSRRRFVEHLADRDEASKDLVVIGGGVAGYVAAIKAAQSGLKVMMADSIELDK